MKNSITVFALAFGLCLCFSAKTQNPTLTVDEEVLGFDGAIMTFEKMIVDYGSIAQNSDPLRVVSFTNTGTEPLVIQNARGSCGCTVPTYPKEPIMPGQTSKIEIRYDTKRLGRINKTVTITTNEGGQPHVLKVIGSISKEIIEEGVPSSKNNLLKSKNN